MCYVYVTAQIHTQARVGFAGFLMETFCFYMLMYMVGECFECAMPESRPALAETESDMMC